MAPRIIGWFTGLLRSWWAHRASLAISLGISILGLVIYFTTFVGERPTPIFDFVSRLELDSLDTRFRLRGRVHPDLRIMIVDIDQRSQEALGRWPFPRIVFARMLDVLREDGARVVGFDISFTEPDQTAEPLRQLHTLLQEQRKRGQRVSHELLAEIEKQGRNYNYDEEFAAAIGRFHNVVLGNFFLYTKADLGGMTDEVLDRYANLLAYFPYPQVRASSTAKGAKSYLALIQNYQDLSFMPHGTQANTETLTQALAEKGGATGFFNVFTDPDSVVRRVVLALPYGRDPDRANWDMYASLEVQTIRLYLGLPNDQTVLNFGEAGVASLEFGPSLAVHPDDVSRMAVNYQGPVRSYKYVSIADVVNKNFSPGTFKDKIILVGASATGIGDLRATPYGGVDYPGVEIHANAIDMILNKKFLQRGANQAAIDLLWIFLFGIPLGLWLALSQPRGMALAPLLLAPFLWLNYLSFVRGWWLNFIMPAAVLIANTGFVALYRVLVEEREKRKVRGAFQQYLSPEVVRILLQNPRLVEPRKTDVTLMFTDVRDFTSISERLDAQELAVLLNHYLTEMTRILFTYGATLDKYMGDAVMAIWNAPLEQPDHARLACRTALEMSVRLRELQDEWKARNQPVLRIGIGLSTGVASVGNMGSELRYGYTAMGDVVNLASRLEGLNKAYRTQIIVAESTRAVVGDQEFLFRKLDLIRVKGKQLPVAVYELLSRRDQPGDLADLAEMFAEGRKCYCARDWLEAVSWFEKVLVRWPADGPSQVFLERCQEYLLEEPEADWDGVHVMKTK